MQRLWVVMLLLGWCGLVRAQAALSPLSGQWRWLWQGQQANAAGPLAAANALQPGTVVLPAHEATLETELRLTQHGITGVFTGQQQRAGGATTERAWLNELYATHDGGAWQFSVGKKIVVWDVGYGFRPNDRVQQELRRSLVSSTPEGRPLLLAEHFDASSAWSLVWVNPTASASAVGAQEPALAGRYYRRAGAVDGYGFAGAGAHSGASVGAALAWVGNEALELHASLRWSQQADVHLPDPSVSGLVAQNPWQPTTLRDAVQGLLGVSWTHQSQLSLLAEAWWDDRAPSDTHWAAWQQRNRQLSALAAQGAPAAAVAGNLAWQAQGLAAAQNLRRSNVLLRLTWQNGAWQPALDLLYTPADRGRVLTAGLTWQGDRMQVQGGLRLNGGAADAVLAQLASRQVAYLILSWAF